MLVFKQILRYRFCMDKLLTWHHAIVYAHQVVLVLRGASLLPTQPHCTILDVVLLYPYIQELR